MIATGFEDNYPGALSNKPFSAPEKKEESAPVSAAPVSQSVSSSVSSAPAPAAGESTGMTDDGWDDIFKIFNQKH